MTPSWQAYKPRTHLTNHLHLASEPMQSRQPKLYNVVLRSGTISLLAPDSESAAWMALELSQERNDKLIDVRQADEW